MATSNLASLKLTAATKPQKITVAQFRRNKLSKRIWEQIQLANAEQQGMSFTVKQMRTVKNAETGERRSIEQDKRVKPWWFTAENGKLAVAVRYGARVLPLNGKGLSAVEVEGIAALAPTLETLKAAVEAGELDAAMEAASAKIGKAFKK